MQTTFARVSTVAVRHRPLLMLGLCVLFATLTSCAGVTGQVQTAATETLNGVKIFTAFTAIAMVVFWAVYGILFGIRGVWPEGFNQVSSTWKPALFITVGMIVGFPALISWAGGIVSSGGFTGS